MISAFDKHVAQGVHFGSMSRSTPSIGLTLVGATVLSAGNITGLLTTLGSRWALLATGLTVLGYCLTFGAGILIGRWGPTEALDMAEAFRTVTVSDWSDPDGTPAIQDLGAWWEVEPEEVGK